MKIQSPQYLCDVSTVLLLRYWLKDGRKLVKYKKVFYYLNFYARTGLLEESFKIWHLILDTIVFEE